MRRPDKCSRHPLHSMGPGGCPMCRRETLSDAHEIPLGRPEMCCLGADTTVQIENGRALVFGDKLYIEKYRSKTETDIVNISLHDLHKIAGVLLPVLDKQADLAAAKIQHGLKQQNPDA